MTRYRPGRRPVADVTRRVTVTLPEPMVRDLLRNSDGRPLAQRVRDVLRLGLEREANR